jgi:hypothetical protein
MSRVGARQQVSLDPAGRAQRAGSSTREGEATVCQAYAPLKRRPDALA